jgi:predicted protein tyrosine phosphatase
VSIGPHTERGSGRIQVLFVCSRNQWRSPTAEQVWRRHPVSAADIEWAGQIFVMEEKHKSRLRQQFGRLLDKKTIHVLDIPDEYQYMQPELVDQLQQSVASILGLE